MKVSKSTLETMKADIKTVCDFFNVKPSQFVGDTGMMSLVWQHVWMNRRYDDSNANVKFKPDGTRLLDRVEDYPIYPDDTNDDTLKTALKAAFNEL